MKHTLPFFLGVVALGILGSESLQARSGTLVPTANTGAPDHNTCAECHTNSAGGSGNVAISFSGGDMYEVGQLYSMSVTITDSTKLRYGFSMVARSGGGDLVNVGSWSLAPSSANVQVHGPGNANVAHQNAPIGGPPSKTYEMNWTAPATATGDITFYVASVAGNGSTSLGDLVYTNTLTISEMMVANNLPPELTVPGSALDATTGVDLAVGGISVADPDAADGDLTLTLTVQAGTLTLSETVGGGLAAGDITDNGTASVTATGTLAELNATLADAAGVIYRSEFGFLGDEVMQVLVNDNGNTGPGGEMTDQEGVTITVHPQPSLSGFAFVDGDFQFALNGISGQTYDVFYTDNLETWTLLEQVTLVDFSLQITDGDPPPGMRLYRAEEATP